LEIFFELFFPRKRKQNKFFINQGPNSEFKMSSPLIPFIFTTSFVDQNYTSQFFHSHHNYDFFSKKHNLVLFFSYKPTLLKIKNIQKPALNINKIWTTHKKIQFHPCCLGSIPKTTLSYNKIRRNDNNKQMFESSQFCVNF
jgi:hypothetical protein